jgi:hypothetical protein
MEFDTKELKLKKVKNSETRSLQSDRAKYNTQG